jgi:uncharacterized membrane protein
LIGIASLLLATIAFVGTHFALSHPLRLTLIRNFGEAGFTLLYSVVAFATLGWMVLAWRALDSDLPRWIAPGWWWPFASALMLLASILLVGSLIGNPAFPRPGANPARQKARAATGVFAITRHPMNTSVALWALAHLSLWWSARNLIVAAGILILAVAGSIGQDRKKAAAIGEPWRQWMARTSYLPFGALVAGRAKWRDAAPGWIALAGGTALWLAVVTFHAPTVSPLVWIWQSLS